MDRGTDERLKHIARELTYIRWSIWALLSLTGFIAMKVWFL